MMTHDMDCRTLDNRLADYLEGELPPAERRQLEAHVASCVRCAPLVWELEQIRAGAAALPELTPSRDLWAGIAQRIEAPVVPFIARATPNVVAGRRFDRLRSAAIAAALVAVTAGVTYTLTVARNEAGHTTTVTTVTPAPDSNAPATPLRSVTPEPPGGVAANEPTTADPEATAGPARQNVRNAPEPVTDSREIDRLRAVFVRNRSQLDPRTAAIIEANLKVIDEAIAQSKAALEQDPASRFLKDQLKSAVDKKVELLRTAALLPNRT